MDDEQFKRNLQDIISDRTRGASDLGRRCLEILADSARTAHSSDVDGLRRRLARQAEQLAAARPSMASIQNLVQRWQEQLDELQGLDLHQAQAVAAKRAVTLIDTSRDAVALAAVRAATLVGAGKTVMTHSLSSTVAATCEALRHQGLSMIVTESRPLNEGRRLARLLSDWRVPTVFITDAQMALFVAQADVVLVGADSVLADGAVVNKAGTRLLALAARDQNTPVYVCFESFKRRGLHTEEVILEEMDVAELQYPAPPGVAVRNLYFDVTPRCLVSAWITEDGIVHDWGKLPS
jgi:translation initiation factor 2B subunit (eIF-2B alpha/beta/delta family)